VRVGRIEVGEAAFGGEGRIETGSAIAVGMLGERSQAGNLIFGWPFVIEPGREPA
jgi:hypothetical protein